MWAKEQETITERIEEEDMEESMKKGEFSYEAYDNYPRYEDEEKKEKSKIDKILDFQKENKEKEFFNIFNKDKKKLLLNNKKHSYDAGTKKPNGLFSSISERNYKEKQIKKYNTDRQNAYLEEEHSEKIENEKNAKNGIKKNYNFLNPMNNNHEDEFQEVKVQELSINDNSKNRDSLKSKEDSLTNSEKMR